MDPNATPKRGAKYRVMVSCVAWLDLLGYGAMLQEAGFDPTDPRASEAVERIRLFHSLVRAISSRDLRTMVMNDAAVCYRDLSPRTSNVTYEFLERVIFLFKEINKADQDLGYPGARMIIASGFRLRIDDDGYAHQTSIARSIFQRLEEGRVGSLQAVHEALVVRPDCAGPPALQANFALTKAYLVDAAGSAAGFAGANCYVDLALLADGHPSWLNIERTLNWEGRGLAGSFALVTNMQIVTERPVHGVRDARGVSEALAAAGASNRLLSTRIREDLRQRGTGR